MTTPPTLWLLGCGNMGGALAARWAAAGLAEISVIDPDPRGVPPGLSAAATPPAGQADILVLAVKPQVWRVAIASLAGRIAPGTLIVSIMAGVPVAHIASACPQLPIVRAMPNTPARLGQGITALWTSSADPAVQQRATELFTAAGETVWLDTESQFDAVTGLSGSGPAYVFAVIEALAAAGEAQGLAPALATQLARATVTGAAALAASDRANSPAVLREAVTSPGGTTAAGLAVLIPALEQLMTATVAAGARRSRELAAADPFVR